MLTTNLARLWKVAFLQREAVIGSSAPYHRERLGWKMASVCFYPRGAPHTRPNRLFD
jgi:hypothetical protein